MDLVGSNSGNTNDLMLNLTYVLYTSIGNDTAIIDYGNNVVKSISLVSSC